VTPIRCACGNWLGVRHENGDVEIRHRGRKAIGPIREIVCEHCGEVWRAEMSEGRKDPALTTLA
jgi:hypothetical protein